MSGDNNYGQGGQNPYDPNNQQPQYDPNQYGQQPQQPQYDPNQYGQPQQPQYDPNQYGQQPQYDPNQYGQQPQQPQYDPNQCGQQPQPYGGPEMGPPKKSKLPIIVISAVLVVALGVAAFFLFGKGDKPGVTGGVSRSQDPEKYLQAAMENTTANFSSEEGSLGWPDLNRFSEGPSEVSISGDVRTLYDSPELEGASAELIVKSAEEKVLIDLSLGFQGIQLNNNQLFVSNDLLALSIPDIYTRHKYITVNPQSLVQDWNASTWGAMQPLPEDALDEFTGMFSSLEGAESLNQAAETMVNSWSETTKTYFGSNAFKDEDTVTIDVGGKSVEAAKMSYSISADQAPQYFGELGDAMRVYMEDYVSYMGSIASVGGGYNPYSYMLTDLEDTFDELGRINFPDGIKIYYYVDLETSLVCRLALEGLTVSHQDYPSELLRFDFNMDVLPELIAMNITLGDGIDSYGINLDMEMLEGDTKGFKMTMNVLENQDSLMDMLLDMTWNSSSKDMVISLDMTVNDYGYEENVRMGLTGKLNDSSDAVTLEDGALTVSYNGEELAVIGIGFGMRSIDAGDVSIDMGQAVSFFDLDMMELMSDLEAGAGRLLGY